MAQVHYIENMPLEGIRNLNDEACRRIAKNIGNNISKNNLDRGFRQLKYEFAKCMNKLIFYKNIPNLSKNLLGYSINISQTNTNPIRKYGNIMIPLRRKDFLQRLGSYCFRCL